MRTRRGKSVLKRAQEFFRFGGAYRVHAHAFGDLGEVQHRPVQVELRFGLGACVFGADTLKLHIEHRIRSVVEDDCRDVELFARQGPKRLDRIHRAAVADQGEHGTIPTRYRRADGVGQALADGASSQRDEIVPRGTGCEFGQHQPRGDGLVYQNGVYKWETPSSGKSGTDLSQINAIKRVCLIIKRVPSLLGGGGAVPPPPKGHHYQGGTVLYLFLWGKMEVTMSHWRKSHEPAPQHSYLADWVIAASVV